MSTRLTFEGPADLSVGRVTVQNEGGVVRDWVATPGQKAFELDDASPGLYTAEIAPLGQRARTFVFEVVSNAANSVISPLFSDLVAGGNEVAFQLLRNPEQAFEGLRKTLRETIEVFPEIEVLKDAPLPPPSPHAPAETPDVGKVLSVALAEDLSPNTLGGWRPYSGGEPGVSWEDSGFNILLAPPAEPGERPPRLRLSLALEDVRVERMMIPLFQGGTRVAFRASPLSTIDVSVQVTALDPERRALIQALIAGGPEEAQAVHDDVLRGGSIERFIDGADADPWAALAAALLLIRFPDVFGPKPPTWAPLLAGRYGWASDAHILLARHELSRAPQDVEGRGLAAQRAMTALADAQDRGAPYFSYANQLFGEMLGGLAALEASYPVVAEQAQKRLAKWRRDAPLQQTAGAVFSWQKKDPTAWQKDGVVLPYRRTQGELDDKYARILFRGRVEMGRISVLSPTDQAAPPKAAAPLEAAVEVSSAARIDSAGATLASASEEPSRLADAPAMSRPITRPDDANKDRFGGQPSSGGYSLGATFQPQDKEGWVEIRLSVQADRSLPPNFSDSVEFFLHTSFNPSRIKVAFRGHEAALTVRAWGGFTVGAWLPARGVELECDLADLPDAPRVVREL